MRGVELLHPDLQVLANKLVGECKKAGIDIKITETFRTKQEQDDLYAQGRTKPGNKVTNVRYPWSNHNWGVAFDICINSKADAYNAAKLEKAGAIGRKLGLYWGGDWPSFKDRPHFESKKSEHITENLIKKYSNPEQFKKSWKETVRPIQKSENYHKIQAQFKFSDDTMRYLAGFAHSEALFEAFLNKKPLSSTTKEFVLKYKYGNSILSKVYGG